MRRTTLVVATIAPLSRRVVVIRCYATSICRRGARRAVVVRRSAILIARAMVLSAHVMTIPCVSSIGMSGMPVAEIRGQAASLIR